MPNSLLADIFGSGDSSSSVAQQWLEKYREDEDVAVLDLINCILTSVGCEQQVTVDDIRDPDNVTNRLEDLHHSYQEVCWYARL